MAKFEIGQEVRVREEYRPGHIRTPFYIRGKHGVIADSVGEFENPESLARGEDGLPKQPLYRVRFQQDDAWPEYAGPAGDTLDIEIYEHWLESGEE